MDLDSYAIFLHKNKIDNEFIFYFKWYYRNATNCDYISSEGSHRPQPVELINFFTNNKVDGNIKFSSTGYNDNGWATTIVSFNNNEDATLFMLVFG
jgi:hypothetical protein